MECDIHSNLCNEKYENGIFIDLVYLFNVFDVFCQICGDMPQLDVDNISISIYIMNYNDMTQPSSTFCDLFFLGSWTISWDL